MKGLNDFYLAKKKILLKLVYAPQKAGLGLQETLNRYVRVTPRLKKFKEAEYFREEFMEPQTDEARLKV